MQVIAHSLHTDPPPCLRLPQEYYGDFVAIDSHHFTIPCPRNELLICARTSSGQSTQE